MHGLEDMRACEDDSAASTYFFEIDENGTPTNLVGVETYAGMSPTATRKSVCRYECGCGQAFDSWEDAKDHIIWDNE